MKKSIHSTAELARHLKLSRWSVSRAINGQSGVSDATKEQVRAAMAEFAFAPSAHGRGLRGHRTGVIGVCFRALDTPITIQKISHVQRLVHDRGFRPLFEVAELDTRMGAAVINHFISLHVEGVLFVDLPPGAPTDGWIDRLKQHDIPAAHLEPLGPVAHNAVHLDRVAAMAELADHLLRLGHERLGLIGINPTSGMGRPRYEGVKRALATHGKTVERSLAVFQIPHQRPAGLRLGQAIADQLIALKQRPTALLAINDDVAAGAMWQFQRKGFVVPRDLSIVGFDNLVLSEQTTPALSTVDHRVEETAQAAAAILFKLIEQGAHARVPTVRIPPRLVLRESTAPAR